VEISLQATSYQAPLVHDGSEGILLAVPGIASTPALVGAQLQLYVQLIDSSGQLVGTALIWSETIPDVSPPADSAAWWLPRAQYGFGDHLLVRIVFPSTTSSPPTTVTVHVHPRRVAP